VWLADAVDPARAASASKVDPFLERQVREARGEPVEYLVVLEEQADLSSARSMRTKEEKGRFVFDALTAAARRTQPAVRAVLRDSGADVKSFWIANALLVRGGRRALRIAEGQRTVRWILPNMPCRLAPPVPVAEPATAKAVAGLEWNISKIRAPEVWALGYTGQGVVVGGQDTGYLWTHPALQASYRGWSGSAADHNYNWHDAVAGTRAPNDAHGHGTHTMGTITGLSGSEQIGVAPGARWIGCRNMDAQGWGSYASYLESFQWFLAPTDLDGNHPDPSRAPDVMSNSWTFTVEEGCTNSLMLRAAVEACRAAGIVVVAAAGNEGPAAGSCASPPAIYGETFTVGAVSSTDLIASFSSRGPVTVDGSGRLKPDISAPGVNIRSSVITGGYATKSGTSMAAPHVAGTVALILSAHPGLRGHVDRIETLITRTAVPYGGTIPNTDYGWGRIDAWAAVGLDDSDSDGMQDWWESIFGLDPANDGDATADADDDGISNAAEWTANTDPTDGGSALEICQFLVGAPAPDGVTVTWNSRQDGFREPRCYDVYRGDRMDDPPQNWVAVATNVAAAGDTTSITNHVGSPGAAAFYRVRIRE
jgi:hypothetical protein